MGQIFSRIKRITKSYTNDFERNDSMIEDNDRDDLRRIIDDLNNSKTSGQFDESTDGPMTIEKANTILGTNHNSTPDEVKSAYLQKIKEYHPDKVASLGDELKKLAEKKTLEINLAYQFLTKV